MKTRAAGFVFDRIAGYWYTNDVRNAARLRDYADETAKKIIARTYLVRTPWSGRVPSNPGLRPLPFQKPAIKFALERNRCYWWNDMGTGKGPCSAMVINALASKGPLFVVFVTPPDLIYNVETELKKWLVGEPLIEIFSRGYAPYRMRDRVHVLIMPDTMIAKYLAARTGAAPGDLLVVDEADRFKNASAARTKALLGYESRGKKIPGLADSFDRILYMSGTALPNGDATELYPILRHSAPELIGFAPFYRYAFRYCYSEKNAFGTKFFGLKNEKEWREQLRPFLFRLKKEKLGLPNRIETALVISADMKPQLEDLDRRLRKFSPEDLMKKSIAVEAGKKDEDALHLMTYRRLLGVEKVRPLLPYIKTILATESVLIGCLHTEVVDALAAGLKKFCPVVIDGRVDKFERHARLESFKRDEQHRPVIANLHAMKRGHTILKCRRVLLVEFDWVPGSNDQFTDRSHRIGQTEDVYVQYAVFRNSVDIAVVESKLRKRKNIAKAEGET